MSENVVSELMSDDESAFIARSLLNRGIPDHDALRRSQARHVSVDGLCFPAGLHQEHAIRRNGNTRMFCELFNGSNEVRMFLTQWFEFVEQRIDHQGGDHNYSQENQDRRKPEIQPP